MMLMINHMSRPTQYTALI